MFGFHGHRHHGPRGGGFGHGPFAVAWRFEGGRGDGEGFGRHGGRGGRGRMFDSGELRLVLLSLIADAPRHGYDLIRAIEERTGGAYAPSPGVIYPTLTMLDDMELIAAQTGETSRKSFAITDAGAAHLAERRDEADALLARLDALGTMRAKTDGGPIRRAMGNMRAVLHHRLGRDDVSAETLHDVAAILDEAAQRIERL